MKPNVGVDRAPNLKSGYDIAHELALIYLAYQGKPLEYLADVCREYMDEAIKTLAPAKVRKLCIVTGIIEKGTA